MDLASINRPMFIQLPRPSSWATNFDVRAHLIPTWAHCVTVFTCNKFNMRRNLIMEMLDLFIFNNEIN